MGVFMQLLGNFSRIGYFCRELALFGNKWVFLAEIGFFLRKLGIWPRIGYFLPSMGIFRNNLVFF